MKTRRVQCERIEIAQNGDPVAKVPPEEFMIMARPEFVTSNGTFILDDEAIEKIVAAFKDQGNELPIDFEHQIVNAEINGQPAPAAGWIKAIEVREDGIWATDVKWNARAAQMLQDREYRFHSPTFFVDDETNQVVSIEAESLVNTPATKNQIPLAAKRKGADGGDNTNPAGMERNMDEQTLKAIGVETDAEAVAAFTKMQTAKKDVDERLETASKELEVATKLLTDVMETAKCEDRTGLVGAIKAAVEGAETAKKLSEELDTIKAKKDEAEKKALIEAAKQPKNIAEWLASKPLADVREYCERCASTTAVSTTPQATAAISDDVAVGTTSEVEKWFKEDCWRRGITDGDAIAKDWKAHLEHKRENRGRIDEMLSTLPKS